MPLPGRPGTAVLPMCSIWSSGRTVWTIAITRRDDRETTGSHGPDRRGAALVGADGRRADDGTRRSVEFADHAHVSSAGDSTRWTSANSQHRIAAADRVVVDLGTGDGRAVRRPRSPRAGRARHRHRRQRRGDGRVVAPCRATHREGWPAERAVRVAAAERHPTSCAASPTRSRSCSRGARCSAARSPSTTRRRPPGIAALVAPGGVVRGFVSITDRDAATADLRPLTAADADAIARRWADHGLTLTCFEPAGAEAIDASGSTWARRLTAGRRRGADSRPRPPNDPSGRSSSGDDSGRGGRPG